MSRDWKKDMRICEQSKANGFSDGLTFLSILPEIGIHWLQQYAATKEELAKINCDYYADKQRFVVQRRELEETTRREQKLKEALEHCIREFPQWDSKEIAGTLMVDYMNNILSILYPKEETK
ncbi:hypothetical protein [Paenibacillus sp. BR1-192]|uniref:hypothetical protein n=1 Tax=Paenibacillus sp. BR1-192 TaxID=3032287 RepID=UPI00240D4D4F|nr:hypothetical protein [Paenibacillus sp. BR1-192]WFB57489.1 hypothetical protein P0X86_26525 [Paenibacillus sp. BR1-192]